MSEPLVPQTASPDPRRSPPPRWRPSPSPRGLLPEPRRRVLLAPRGVHAHREAALVPGCRRSAGSCSSLGFTAIWMNKMDAREFMKTQLEESGQWDKIPGRPARADPRELGRADEDVRLGRPGRLHAAHAAGRRRRADGRLPLLLRRARSPSGRRSRSCAWTFFAVALVTTPLLLLVIDLKGDWNLNPQNVVQANLGCCSRRTRSRSRCGPCCRASISSRSGWSSCWRRLRGGQPQEDERRRLGRRHPVAPHRPVQGGLGGDLLISCSSRSRCRRFRSPGGRRPGRSREPQRAAAACPPRAGRGIFRCSAERP